ncbi:MAG: chain-length determining protein, partial [Sphingobium sp.]
LVSDREETRLRGDVQSEAGKFRVRLIDPPGLSSVPASPNRPLLLVGVLIAAVGAGVGLAFVLGQLKTTYATAGRLERATGITVLGAVTETLGVAAVAKRRRMLGIFAGAGAGLVAMCLMLVVLEFVQRGMAA